MKMGRPARSAFKIKSGWLETILEGISWQKLGTY